MHRSHPLPRIWMMTDERFGDEILRVIRRMPYRSGVIFRHYTMPMAERRQLFRAVRHLCKQRGHILLLAGDARTAVRWGADGHHQRGRRNGSSILSAPVHNSAEIRSMRASQPDLLFISPVYPTRSHPGAKTLGPMGFNRLAALGSQSKIIALGGMTRQKAHMMKATAAYGWAAIDAFKYKQR